MMAHQVYFLLLIFFYSLNQAASEVYHITTNSESSPTDLCTVPCLTLSEFTASLNHTLSSSNITLVFLPGTHYLTVYLSVSNLDYFSMTSESLTAQVVCKNYSHIHFSHSRYISISNLEFSGCGDSQVEHVEEITVKDAKFEGQNASGTTLEFIETATQIVNSTFKLNKRGKFKQLIHAKFYQLTEHNFIGGAIIANNCEINISQCRFENNGAELGGAIYAEHSIIMIKNSTFTNNSADIRGGAFLSSWSIVTIVASKFVNKTANLTGDYSGGGVLYSNECTITIETSEFDSNTANTNGNASGGGVMYSFRDNITIRASKFDSNSVISRDNFSGGGVLYSRQKSTVTIETSEFDNNTINTIGQYGAGGGILYSISDNNITIRTSKFDGNGVISRGDNSGGGVLYSYGGSTITIETSEFDNNAINSNGSAAGGGVLYSGWHNNITIRTSKFDGNGVISRGYCSGGGVLCSCRESTITIETSEFDNNTINTNGSVAGGGVLASYVDNKITIRASKFDGNGVLSRGDNTGGGVLYSYGGSSITIETSEFDNNAINSNGSVAGGGVLYSVTHNNIAIRTSKFDGNGVISKGDNSGGGVLYSCEWSTITIETSEFDNNIVNTNGSAAGGGVLYSNMGSNITIRASKFDDNCVISRGDKSGGGVLYSISWYLTITGSKFDGNSVISRGNFGGGGVLYSDNGITITIETSEFDNNTISTDGSTAGGGVLYSISDNITIRASKFDGNSVISRGNSGGGGVLYSYKGINITIETSGFDNNTINTNGSAAGGGVLYSISNNNIKIRTSKFDGNGVISRGAKSGGGVLYSNSDSITIRASKFDANSVILLISGDESGGGVLYSIRSNITTKASKFDDNTVISKGIHCGGGVLYSEECTVAIETSNFDNNTADTNSSGAGGGVLLSYFSSIAMKANKFNCNTARRGGVLFCVRCSITIVASRFHNNSATIFGGVLYSLSSTITIEVERINIAAVYERAFIPGDGNNVTNNTEGAVAYTKDLNGTLHVVENRARYGVVYLSDSELNVKHSGGLIMTLSNNVGSLMAENSKIILIGSIEFRNNSHGLQESFNDTYTIKEGGAITLRYSDVYLNGSCSVYHNQAEDGGGLLSIESKLYVSGDVTIAHNTATRDGGGVYLLNSELNCQKKSSFLLNDNHAGRKGGGLHAINSSIKAASVWNIRTEARLHFNKNTANMGGGLSLYGNAKFYIILLKYAHNHDLKHSITVAFTDNSADTYGGAVYVDDDTNSGTCTSSSKMECFFQVLDVSEYIKPQLTHVQMIYFSQNHANVSGSTLFGGLLDRCAVSQFAELYKDGVTYFKRISTPIYNTTSEKEVLAASNISISSGPVKLCICFENEPLCYRGHHLMVVAIKKGEAFNISLVAVDQTEQPVNATIHASLESTESHLSEGQTKTEIQGECTNLTFNVFSPHKFENLTLYALDGPCKDADLSRRVIKIKFLPCSCLIGFQILRKTDHETNCICDCHSDISQYTEHCDSYAGTFVKKSRAQSRAWISYINDTDLTGYLVYDNCPFDYCNSLSLPIDLNQPNGADTQCAFNRSSLLCGSCQSGLSLSLGSSRCLPCPSYWPALLIAITIAAILAGIALVALLLFLNMTVAVGALNGLIFYANVVHANKSILLPFQETNFVTVFISLLNLELGIDTCYFPGMNTYIKAWLQLAFPGFVFYLVILIIVVSSYSIRFSKFIGSRDPVATLATLILLSYAKLLQVCFESLSVGILWYPNGFSKALWLPDAAVQYFHGKHIPLFIAALLILLVGLIYTTVLFSWQWRFYLPRWKIFTVCLRSQKLQFFIETYHAPFTEKYRYWTGLLLIARAILYLVAAANVSNDPQLALSAIIFITTLLVILIVLVNIRMYKKMPVNVLETFFILNILSFSIVTVHVYSGANIDQKAVAYTSVHSTFIILVLIILYHVYTYTSIFSMVRKMNLCRMINRFRADPIRRAGHNQRLPPDDNTHRFKELLDMIAGPANTNDYNVPLLDRQPVEPTYSVVELPDPQHTDEPVTEEANIRNIPGPC